MNHWKTMTAVALTAIVSTIAAADVFAGPITSYEAHVSPSGFNATPVATPRWTAALEAGGPSTVEVAEGKALFVRGGVLTAVDVDTGKTVWTYGDGVLGSFQTFRDGVLAATADGRLHWIDLATGKAAWSAALRDSVDPEEAVYFSAAAADDAVYVTSYGGLAAFDRDTGRKLWTNDTFDNGGYVSLRGEHLLFITAEQGALTVIANYGIDRESGKTLWRLGGSHGALERVEGDIGWFRDDWSPTFAAASEPSYVSFDLVDLNAGQIAATKTYGPLPARSDPSVFGGGLAVVDDEWIFASSPTGEVAQYHIEAEESAKPTAAFGGRNQEWIAGPYDGKLFFLDRARQGALYGIRLLDRTPVYYEGLDNPASRIDWIERGVFVGQTDGEIYALNVATGKAVFRYRTEARNYGPFHVENGVLLAQADGRLLAFDLPAELLHAENADQATAPPGTDAILTIDGASQRFEPAPVMIDDRLFVPMRALFQAVGAGVQHDQATGLANVTYGDRAFALKEGAPFAIIGGEQQSLSYAPVLLNNALYVPLRDASDLLGIEVLWVTETRAVEIRTTANKQ